jgi:CDGSH-type Zn-finger protein
MNDKGEIAGRAPMELRLEEGRNYAWCSCGKSATQPLCDGSHKPSAFRPVMLKAEKNESVWLCVCKQTSTPPFCDGAHKNC